MCSVMHIMLAALPQFNFCYLLRSSIISGVHGAFSLSTYVHAQNIETQKFALRKSFESFDAGFVKS